MKKIISLAIALAMMTCIGMGANAQTITSTDEGSNSSSADVNAKFVPSVPAADCVCVDIEWGSMDFTYTQGEKTWNPNYHTEDTSEGKWTAEGNDITITNHSNININVEYNYNADAAFSNVSGDFYEDNEYNSPLPGFRLDAANGVDGPSKRTVYFMITSGTVDSSVGTGAKIGTITVTIDKNTLI